MPRGVMELFNQVCSPCCCSCYHFFLLSFFPFLQTDLVLNLAPNLILPMVAAISNGMYTAGLEPLGVPCPTGNCTWPTIPTLAVCSDCRNVTENLTTTCDGHGPGVTHCNSTLPNGAYLYGTRNNSLDPVMNVTALNGPSQALVYTNETYPYVLLFNILASERLPRGERGNVSAYECAIWFCTQAYSISVQNGRVVQSTILTWDVYANNALSQGRQEADFNFSVPPPDIQTRMNIYPNATYSISSKTFLAVYYELSKLFTGSVVTGPATTTYTSDAMQGLWTSNDPLSWMQNIALSITNHIRSTPTSVDTNGQPLNFTHGDWYKGTVYGSEAFIQVKWGWLAYPVAILVLSSIFSVITIIHTQGNKVGLWKNNPLALLYCPLEDSVRDQLSHQIDKKTCTSEELEVKAKDLNVFVGKDGDGWKFRRTMPEMT
jgi:hypothetical protein